MPFHIVRNDIAAMAADAIVNTANPMPVIGDGVDAAIHEKAGPELLAARKAIGKLAPGECAVTPAFGLSANYVIHVVGPVWKGGLLGEGRLLRRCYESALALAQRHGCESIALPLISTGNYGFPRERALNIALNAIGAFLLKHDMTVYLVVYDRESCRLSRDHMGSIVSYIDDNYVALKEQSAPLRRNRADRADYAAGRSMVMEEKCCAPMMAPCASAPRELSSLDELLAHTDAGFTETLLKLIDRTGKKDSVIYKRANVSRQHFSKIRNDSGYKPTKATAIAFAMALELDLEQAQDLIGRAGYTLTRASKFDVAIMYFIDHRVYDIMDINLTLFNLDLPTLGE